MCTTRQLSNVVDGKPDACTYANLFQNIAFFTVIAAAYIIAMVTYFSSFSHSSRDHNQPSTTRPPFYSKTLQRTLAVYQIICIAILQGSAYFLSPPVVAAAGTLAQLYTTTFAVVLIKGRVHEQDTHAHCRSWRLLLERDFGSLVCPSSSLSLPNFTYHCSLVQAKFGLMAISP